MNHLKSEISHQPAYYRVWCARVTHFKYIIYLSTGNAFSKHTFPLFCALTTDAFTSSGRMLYGCVEGLVQTHKGLWERATRNEKVTRWPFQTKSLTISHLMHWARIYTDNIIKGKRTHRYSLHVRSVWIYSHGGFVEPINVPWPTAARLPATADFRPGCFTKGMCA